ncbi:bifunctional diguanylate cyclase/phosphodiesterase [Aquabacterium sp.]|uniref:putative bifunctional diguanylate cyclase/phosphodiesterase n=1 Tax=Aquabacterium sp. TaxID=1872578 RepID=UPI0027BA155F|nr:EAL domain-containing protein [Aquabacterium sp.]
MSLSVFLHPSKLHNRIAGVYLALLLGVQALSYWFIQDSIDGNARAAIQTELDTGEKVLLHLIDQNANSLEQATRVLAADYGFRSAVASGDRETVNSALLNHSERIRADLALFTDPDFVLQASTTGQADRFLAAVKRQADQALAGTSQARQIEIIGGEPFQIVAVPVRAPALIGWVGMGFRVDETKLQDIRALSGLEVALLRPRPAADPDIALATFERAQWPALQQAWQASASRATPLQRAVELDGDEYSARSVVLNAAPGQAAVTAVLMRSVDQALAPYERLQLTLLILTGLGVIVFAVGGLYTAQRITTPLRSLTASARRLEQGDYGDAVHARYAGEIGELAQSFETMRQAIQTRESQISRLAYEDALTALPNRVQFRLHLQAALQHARDTRPHGGGTCAVLMLDMDRFKHVNDVLGHRFGDRLLQAVAERLRTQVLSHPRAELARLSGDEFAVLLPNTEADDAIPVAQRILRAFETPLTLDEHTVDLSAGIGVAIAPEHGDDPDLLLSRAEIAMYVAKRQQAGVVVYHPGLDSTSEESLTLLSELRQAVDTHQLRVFLQPKIDLRTGQAIGAEALVRWAHPTRGMVPPMRFIPFAEQSGFIRVITLWVIEQVAQLGAQLEAQGLALKLAVNLSTRDLMDPELPHKIAQLIERHRLTPERLVLEITESAIMDDPQRALQTLERLHALGVKLSIDDFGTGYSSLAYLKRLPVDELKIDQSFVKHMESDLDDAKIVRSTIDLAHNLGLSVVAEGVETAKAWKLLAGLDCDEIQGYFVAKPMPADTLAEWLTQWHPPDTDGEVLATDFSAMLN